MGKSTFGIVGHVLVLQSKAFNVINSIILETVLYVINYLYLYYIFNIFDLKYKNATETRSTPKTNWRPNSKPPEYLPLIEIFILYYYNKLINESALSPSQRWWLFRRLFPPTPGPKIQIQLLPGRRYKNEDGANCFN